MKGISRPVDIFLSPIAFAKYTTQFRKLGLEFEIVVDDFQTKVEEEERSMHLNRNAGVLTKYSKYADVSSSGPKADVYLLIIISSTSVIIDHELFGQRC